MKFKDYLTEMLHLDFIEKTDLEKAKNIGNIHDQKYIYDVAKKENIKL